MSVRPPGCGPIGCGPIGCGTIGCGTIVCGPIVCGTIVCGPIVCGPIVCGTVTSPDLDASVAAYRASFGWRLLGAGRLSPAMAASLGAPLLEGRRWALLGCRADDAGLVRIVESHPPGDGHAAATAPVPAVPEPPRRTPGREPPSPAPAPLTRLGWAALEIAVQDADATAALLDRDAFRVLGLPKPLGSTGGALRALQVAGPGNEVLYLTQRLRELDGFELPNPTEMVNRVFIAVLATHRLEEERAVLEESFGARRASDHAVAIGVLNTAFGLDPATTHRLSSVQLAGQSLVELDEYPPAAAACTAGADGIPSGVVQVTLAAPARPEGTECWRHPEPPYGGRPSWALRLPGGASIELVEAQPTGGADQR